MIQQGARVPAGIDHKEELLKTIYAVYSQWVERFPLACQKGCASCCTQSVTMTSLEGEMILDFFKVKGKDNRLAEQLAQRATGHTASLTTYSTYQVLTRRIGMISRQIYRYLAGRISLINTKGV